VGGILGRFRVDLVGEHPGGPAVSTLPDLIDTAARALWDRRAPHDLGDVIFEALPEEYQQHFLRDADTALMAAGVADALIEVDRLKIEHAAEIGHLTARLRHDQQWMSRTLDQNQRLLRLIRDLSEGKIDLPTVLDEARKLAAASP
jgi:hypothetical protein